MKDGKDRQRARRERPGGPVQDGYRKRPIIDAATGDRIATAFEIDPKREPTIRRMFKLIVGGMAFKPCADKLNAEGHVSTTGLPWNRRSVEDKATHPFYAGAVVWYRGKPGEEIIWSPATEHPAYITREQHEAILAARSRRDRAKGSDRRPGTGRPNAYHLLAGLAFCARCGAKMRARRTGTYKGRAYRGYRCATAEDYPGTCDAPTIRIEDLDGPLLDALPGLMVDFEGWIDGQLANRSESKERIEAQLGAQVEALATVDRRIAKLADRYADAVGADDDDRADREAEVLDRERSKRPEIERRIAELEVGLEATDQPTQHDAALDWWNDLRSDLAAAKGSDTLIDARSRLAARFARVVLDTAGEEIVIRFELHEEAGGAVLDVPIEEEPGAEHVFILGQSGTPFPPQPVPTRVPAGNARNAHE